MSVSRKAINFDLYTNELKKHFQDTREAYAQVKEFMLKNGFEHRQYSGYASKNSLSERAISKLSTKLVTNFPWLASCVKRFDVTDIGEQYDLTDQLQILSKSIHKDIPKNSPDKEAKLAELRTEINKATQSKTHNLNTKNKNIER
ncbi:hypothetical protein DMB95_09355 [Campylobacter sp. MIT 12-8780]|uniref:VapD family protein n=1 Tax=unclassified Campylobacter TaxID=2593542 RepID=UPI0010F45259|nr:MULTISPECIES: VapD family protein [unclassified Campylobacter]NDJ28044.1 hypothetical protein [Campylobacter sp. MIT 19-121]TKX28271.1 hypothetical protein CQA38_08475 [Campylobacter sp. MIT 12-5580]TQR39996.1 hypothetical protein DMB95_09355 [Campylobacter sp. MIT 12-8780]